MHVNMHASELAPLQRKRGMEYRTLGRTGFRVSRLGHGLWGMSGWFGSSEHESIATLSQSAATGCNFFDSAWAYGEGNSDMLLGNLIQTTERNIVVASKIPPLNRRFELCSQMPYTNVYPAEHVFAYAERIRAMLRVDTIPLLQFHVWDDRWAVSKEFARTVEKLKHDGIIHSFGLSLCRRQPANGIKALKTGLVDCVQAVYNIFDQHAEDELFPACEAMGIGVIARVALDEGSLGGQMTRETRFPAYDWRSGYFSPEKLAATMDHVDRLNEILPAGMTLPEMALRFALSNKQVHTVIIGMRRHEHLRANLTNAARGPLNANLLDELKGHRWERSS
jgi:aryl-alcohol dehydrogenase-like predicted oxidoreductase